MNYYERYCGDYQRDTAHLSLCEHGAFTMMLDTYYATEKPLPADYPALYRICRAMDKAEQLAVRSIADQFFPVAEDGLRHNGRADDMIDKARPKIDAARANGKKGGRPRKPKEETQQKPSGFSFGNPPETQDESSPAPAPLKPFEGANAPSAPSEKISLGDGGWVGIPEKLFSQWGEAYPAVSLKAELAKAAAWIIANPSNRKSNYARFLTNWLTRAQDRAPSQRAGPSRGPSWSERNDEVIAQLTGRNRDYEPDDRIIDI